MTKLTHKEVYWQYFNYKPGDTILCEISNVVAIDIHNIDNDKRGGTKKQARIEDLIALSREIHGKNGDSKKHKAEYYRKHLIILENFGKPFDRDYILDKIEKYK